MAVEWTLTHADATSAIVWVRSDDAETVTIALPHGNFSTTVDPLVEDGTGSITVTGLSGDTAGTINGAPITVKTSPALPVIAFPSCSNMVTRNRDEWAAYLQGLGVNITVFTGDMPYTDLAATTWFGVTTVAIGASVAVNTSANYAAHYKQLRRFPAVRSLLQSSLLYATYDDHEVINNWDWTVSRANTFGTLAADATDVRAVYDRAMAAWEWYNARGNQVPEGLDTNPATHYSTCRHGPSEIFILDSLSHKSPVTAADDGDKYMIGPLQEAALIAGVNGSTATYKIIVSGKQLYSNADANTDGYTARDINLGYTTQRDRILAAIASTAGVVWVSGDDHAATVVDNTTSGCLMLSGCPVGTSNQAGGSGAGYETGVVFKGFGYAGDPPANQTQYSTNVIRLLSSGELSLEVHDINRRTIWWQKYMRADGSTYYPRQRVG